VIAAPRSRRRPEKKLSAECLLTLDGFILGRERAVSRRVGRQHGFVLKAARALDPPEALLDLDRVGPNPMVDHRLALTSTANVESCALHKKVSMVFLQ
jgi:hypothetical protein